jgi:hypothetical protein
LNASFRIRSQVSLYASTASLQRIDLFVIKLERLAHRLLLSGRDRRYPKREKAPTVGRASSGASSTPRVLQRSRAHDSDCARHPSRQDPFAHVERARPTIRSSACSSSKASSSRSSGSELVANRPARYRRLSWSRSSARTSHDSIGAAKPLAIPTLPLSGDNRRKPGRLHRRGDSPVRLAVFFHRSGPALVLRGERPYSMEVEGRIGRVRCIASSEESEED